MCFYEKGVESGLAKLKLRTPHTPSKRSTKLSQSQRWFEKKVRNGSYTQLDFAASWLRASNKDSSRIVSP